MAVEILFMLIFLEYLKVIFTSSLYDVKIALPVRKAGCLKDLLCSILPGLLYIPWTDRDLKKTNHQTAVLSICHILSSNYGKKREC